MDLVSLGKAYQKSRPRFAPVGCCIYCGESEGPLSKEHVIPRGLGGDIRLPAASCKKHADLTSKIESDCLREMLGAYRWKHSYPSGNKGQRASTREITFRMPEGEVKKKEVPRSEYPSHLELPVFPPARILRGQPRDLPGERTKQRYWIYRDIDQIQRLVANEGASELRFETPTSPHIFSRMIAKIGFSFAVGTYGWGSFRPLVQQFILGNDPTTEYFVGCEASVSHVQHPPAFELACGESIQGDGLLISKVRLFAYLPNSPTYHVVVGTLSGRSQGL